MAKLVRPWIVRYLDATGKRCKKGTPGATRKRERARKWYGQSIPGYPPKERVPLAGDKNTAQRMLAELIKKGERGEAGLDDPVSLAARLPLEQHLQDFEAYLRARDTTARQVRLTLTRVRRLVADCEFVYPRDLEADKVMTYLHDRRQLPRDRDGISSQTSNHYLTAAGHFTRWMVRKGRLAANPLADTRYANTRTDRRHERRPLDADQLERLLAVTRASDRTVRRLDGRDRHALYLTACGTGFRAQELAALTPEAFDLDATPPVAKLPAVEVKNRRAVTQPLPAVVADVLRDYLLTKAPGEPVWPGTWYRRGANIIRRDLKAAGIPYVVEVDGVPRYADFHALRHSFVTLLERSGVGPKAAQTLARHGDVRLTLGIYTHADRGQLGSALDRLPLPGSAAPRALTPQQLAGLVAVLGALADALLGCALVAQVAEKTPDTGRHAGTGKGPRRRKAV
jgi:site-specific recombinase XerC